MATIAQIQALRERLVEQRRAIQDAVAAGTAKVSTGIQKIDAALLKGAFDSARIDDVVARYVAVRDEKEALIERQKLEVADYNEQLRDIERWCLGHLAASGSESIKTAAGTVFTKTQTSTKVEDRGVFFAWVLENEALDMLEARCSKLAVEAHLESTGELPPGVSRRAEKVVTINRPSAK